MTWPRLHMFFKRKPGIRSQVCLSHWILSFKIFLCLQLQDSLGLLQSRPESLPGICFLGVLPTRIWGVDRGTVSSPALQIRGWASAHSGIWLYLSLATCPEQALLSQGGNFWAEIGTSSQGSLRNVLSCEHCSSVSGSTLNEG